MKQKDFQEVCGIAKIPIKRSTKPLVDPSNASDLPEFTSIVDEALYLFRANIFFKNFEIKGPADRTLLYSLLFLQECLAQVASASTSGKPRKEIEKLLLISASGSNFPVPGDSNFNLSAIFPNPKNQNESEAVKQYLTELRVELVHGLLDRLFIDPATPNEANKWWLSLSKRKFMNKSL